MKSQIITKGVNGEQDVQQALYFNEEGAIKGQRYEKGNIYHISQLDAEELVKNGAAVPVSFPPLESIELTIDSRLRNFKEKYEEIKNHPRYETNEAERKYQLEQLDILLEQDMNDLKQKYEEELTNLQQEIARESLKVDFKPDETVNAYVDNFLADLDFSDENPESAADLLTIKISAMTDSQKMTFSRRFREVAAALTEKTAGDKSRIKIKLDSIRKELKSAHGQREADMKLRQLSAIKKDNDPLTNYRLYKFVVKNANPERFRF